MAAGGRAYCGIRWTRWCGQRQDTEQAAQHEISTTAGIFLPAARQSVRGGQSGCPGYSDPTQGRTM